MGRLRIRIDILRHRLRQSRRIASAQRLLISVHPAVEGLAQLAHLLADGDVSHAFFAQDVIQRRDIDVEDRLSRILALSRLLIAQPQHQQQHMQRIELESRVDAVVDRQARVEGRIAGLADGLGVEIVAETDARSGFEQVFQHGFQRPLFRRAVELGRRSV